MIRSRFHAAVLGIAAVFTLFTTAAYAQSTTTFAAPAAPEPEVDWAERDRTLGEGNALSGGVGLLHMQHAQGGTPGQFRFNFTAEYFSAGFLCRPGQFSCPGATTGATRITTDTLNHTGGTLSLSGTVTRWLELYASTSAYANYDAVNTPALLQVLGDSNIGFKAFGKLSDIFWLAGASELWLVNGTDAVGVDGAGTTVKFRGLGTLDLRGLESHTPLRFSANLTYALDNTANVISTTEATRGTHITRVERFGLGINRVDQVDINLGGEVFAAEERIRPFVEYQVAIPVNRQNYLCSTNTAINVSNDSCIANTTIIPSKLSLGARFLPWKKGFSATAALDIGVSGVGSFAEELAPTAPWTVFVGAGWAADTWDRPAAVVTKTIDKSPPPRGHLKGFVHQLAKPDAIGRAILAWVNRPELTPLATREDGQFVTQDLAPGIYTFDVHAEGYTDGHCGVELKAAEEASVDCPLEALPRVGTIVGHVVDAVTQAPVANATVSVQDAAGKAQSVVSDASGGLRIENIAVGPARLAVEATGYLGLVETAITVNLREEKLLELRVTPKPKVPNVEVSAKEITIKQQIQFGLDSAVILPESIGLMTEIADILIHNPRIKKTEVQGHTDRSGTAAHNLALSEERANAVKSWLEAHGVASDRLVAKGYGQDKPLAPNITPALTARNRRVQLIILDQDKATNLP